jgi:hypothetical protein
LLRQQAAAVVEALLMLVALQLLVLQALLVAAVAQVLMQVEQELLGKEITAVLAV